MEQQTQPEQQSASSPPPSPTAFNALLAGRGGGTDAEIQAELEAVWKFGEVLDTHESEFLDEEGKVQIVKTYWHEAERLLSGVSDEGEGSSSSSARKGDRTLNVNLDHLPRVLRKFIVTHYERLLGDLEKEATRFIYHVEAAIGRRDLTASSGRSFFLRLFSDTHEVFNVREIRCENVGKFVRMRGQVTRTSDVWPELVEGTFRCKLCGATIEGVMQQHKFTQPIRCSSERCVGRFDFELLPEDSRFGDLQKWRIQEPAQEAGAGAIPRSLELIVRNDQVDTVHPGDDVIVSGALIVVPIMPALLKRGEVSKKVLRQIRANDSNTVAQGVSGMKFIGVREINHRLAFLAGGVEKLSSADKMNLNINPWEENTPFHPDDVFYMFPWVEGIAKDPHTLDRLADLIAPRVYGAREIKVGILLMLAGGVQKQGPASKLRGDINICIVGDPSTGKSQLLKFVETFSSRAIFTSGKGSTAAGLTAAVHRDPETGETVLEAGALMYADHGVCCIDEFDKMNEKDRVSIHEAMEQQTISISKAGVQATLNARACILAGCNPRFGRYDKSKTFSQNVNIPSPLLSRFDLFFTTVDELEEKKDRCVASHLVDMYIKGPKAEDKIPDKPQLLSLEEMKIYIELARNTKPLLTLEAKQLLINFYVGLRTDEMLTSQRSMRITVRQLEALIRLSEAVAKLKFSTDVTPEHVTFACDVFKASLRKVTNVIPELERRAAAEETGGGARTDTQDSQASATAGRPEEHFGELDVSYDHFKRIRDRLIYRVKEYEDQTRSLMRDQDLMQWYVDCFVADAEGLSADKLREWWPRLKNIIHRLIHSDAAFVHKASPDENDDSIFLGVHENIEALFVPGRPSTSPLIQRVEEEENDDAEVGVANNAAAAVYDDIDFMNFQGIPEEEFEEEFDEPGV